MPRDHLDASRGRPARTARCPGPLPPPRVATRTSACASPPLAGRRGGDSSSALLAASARSALTVSWHEPLLGKTASFETEGNRDAKNSPKMYIRNSPSGLGKRKVCKAGRGDASPNPKDRSSDTLPPTGSAGLATLRGPRGGAGGGRGDGADHQDARLKTPAL